MADTIAGNSSTTQSLAVGTASTSGIDFFGDTDWWRVSLSGGYGYQVWVEGSQYGHGTLSDPYLAIYNSAGALQLSNDDSGFLIRDAYLYALPTTGGTFYLSAEEFGGNATGTYTITLWRDELNSTASAAVAPVNGMTTEGHIGWQGDTSDWYAVTLTAGTNYEFDLIGSSNDGAAMGSTLTDPWLALRSATGTALAVDDDSGLGLNSRIFYTPTVSATYYLDVQETGNDGSGTYRLVVNSSPVIGTLLIGTAAAGAISFAGEVNLYSVNLTAGVPYAFALDGVTLGDPFLEVIDSTGASVAADDDSGTGLSSYLLFTPTTSGTYYLAARESGNDATGTYSARVSPPTSISIQDAFVAEGDAGTTNLVFQLTLSNASATAVTVTARTSGTATATYGLDYVALTGTVTFQPGQTAATYTVQVVGDTQFEPTESFHVLLSGPSTGSLGDSDAYGLIIDDDSPYNLPSDLLSTFEWYLYPGTGVNAFPVWPDYTGAGIRVAVFDQGVDSNHPDLDGNLLLSLGRKAVNLSTGGAPLLTTDNHGTAVAGVIAAERNGIGVVGIAYGASLISIYSPLTLEGLGSQIANAYSYAVIADVLNDSWGFANGFTSGVTWAFYDNFQTPAFSAAGAALAALAANGRNGLGTVVVQSAGNSLGLGDDTNLHNFQNSQFIITVAATDYAGNPTTYSSPGASVLIAAPGGGGTDSLSDVVTTDRTGTGGMDASDYTTIAGTSFSAPVVSGVVALMLEANPGLGYRDVQEILAYSARKVAASTNDWFYNGASNWNGGGLHYDGLAHNFGYGLVDARAAVRLAESWTPTAHTAANRLQVSASHAPGLQIPDNNANGAFDVITINQSVIVERAEVTLNVTHPFVGDLGIVLISPSGTVSVLLWRPQQNALSAYGSNRDNIHFTFDTVLDWGENSVGTWTLAMVDYASGDVGTLDSWTLNLIGKPSSANTTYVYTDEFGAASADQPSRHTLSDSNGVDTLNAAAVTGNSMLNLAPGATSILAGTPLLISPGTFIEHAIGGDGHDQLVANSIGNWLQGMRGNDLLQGGSGNDILDGGAGSDQVVGGAGSDRAPYDRSASGYVVQRQGDMAFLVVDKLDPGARDTLVEVETLQFSDKVVDLTVTGKAAAIPSALLQSIVELYVAFFNRVPDSEGMAFWIGQASAGVPITTIANSFYSAAIQYPSLTGYSASMTNADFVNVIYQNVLGRSSADAGGLAFWSNALANGSETHGTLVKAILGSAHTFKGDATWGWVANLLDNKYLVGKLFSVDMGLSFNTPEESISQGMLIAQAVTPTDTSMAISLIGVQPADIHLG